MFEEIQEFLRGSNTWLFLSKAAIEFLNELGTILPVVLTLSAGAELLPPEIVRKRIATDGRWTYRSLRIFSASLYISPKQDAP